MADAKTAFPIESAVHGMSWVYHLAGERSPSEHTYASAKDVRILAGAVFINRTYRKMQRTKLLHWRIRLCLCFV